MKIIISLLMFIVSSRAFALVEISASSSYRKSYLNKDTYDESLAFTGSLSYYFFAQSALELSYTNGQSNRFAPSSTYNVETIYDFEILGADLVLVFAEPQSQFVPYIKGGVAYYSKKKLTTLITDATNSSTVGNKVESINPAAVPSAGVGLKIGVTQSLSIKLGIDAWASRPLDQKPVTYDMAARAGLSWFL